MNQHVSTILITGRDKDSFQQSLADALQSLYDCEIEIQYPGKQHGLYTALIITRA